MSISWSQVCRFGSVQPFQFQSPAEHRYNPHNLKQVLLNTLEQQVEYVRSNGLANMTQVSKAVPTVERQLSGIISEAYRLGCGREYPEVQEAEDLLQQIQDLLPEA